MSTNASRSQVLTIRYVSDFCSWLTSGRQTSKLMVVEFVTSGCSYCKSMDPTVEEFAGRYSQVEFIKIDMSSFAMGILEWFADFALKGYPTFALMKEGTIVDTVVGANKEELRKKIEQHAGILIITPSSMDEWKALLRASKQANKLMVVSFKGGCQPCANMNQAIEKFANKYRDVQFLRIDLPAEKQLSKDLVEEFQMKKCPTVVLVKNEKQVDKIEGPYEEQLMSLIEIYKAHEQSSEIVWLRSMNEWRLLQKACERKMMVVGFTTSWCQQCKMMEPVIVEFASKYRDDVKFIKVDMSSPAKGFSDLAAQFEVCAYPTFILLKKGKPVYKIGAPNKEELMKKIVAATNNDFESDKIVAANNNNNVPSQVVTPRTLDEWSQVKASTAANRLMVVGFTKPNEQQSKFMEQVIEDFAKKYKDVKFVKFSMASPPKGMDLAGQFQVRVYPTIILFKKGNQVDKVVGPNKDDLNTKIATNRIQCGCEWR